MASGAEIHWAGDVVIKVGAPGPIGDRVTAQGKWLAGFTDRGIKCLPHVLARWEGGYAIERLREVVPPDPTQMVECLRPLWALPPVVDLNLDAHIKLIMERNDWRSFEKYLLSHEPDWDELTACLTHGDPTWDNTLFRWSDHELVFIDPLPARPAVPDLLAVDLGKILQSQTGYEDVLAGTYQPSKKNYNWLHQFSEADQRAAWYWAVVHYVRLMDYLPDSDKRREMKKHVETTLLGL